VLRRALIWCYEHEQLKGPSVLLWACLTQPFCFLCRCIATPGRDVAHGTESVTEAERRRASSSPSSSVCVVCSKWQVAKAKAKAQRTTRYEELRGGGGGTQPPVQRPTSNLLSCTESNRQLAHGPRPTRPTPVSAERGRAFQRRRAAGRCECEGEGRGGGGGLFFLTPLEARGSARGPTSY
jgi:hypothetical protein